MKTRTAQKIITQCILALTWTVAALAFEPFDPTREPDEVAAFDHLRPVDRGVPEFRYLAQYWVQSDRGEQRYLVVVRDQPSGRYYIEQGEPPNAERVLNRAYEFKKRVEISASTADMIYELWVNAVLQTHYDRRAPSVMGTGGDKFTFSCFVPNLGWMHGYTWTPTQKDLPPDWMCNAGESLFAFATKSEAARGENELRTKMQSNRDKFFNYLRTHPF